MRAARLDQRAGATHDLPGDTFRPLSPEVAYLKLGPHRRDGVAACLERGRDAQVLVVDHRGYPSDLPLFILGSRLVSGPTAFARFTRADWDNPGAFVWDQAMVIRLRPQPPAATRCSRRG